MPFSGNFNSCIAKLVKKYIDKINEEVKSLGVKNGSLRWLREAVNVDLQRLRRVTLLPLQGKDIVRDLWLVLEDALRESDLFDAKDKAEGLLHQSLVEHLREMSKCYEEAGFEVPNDLSKFIREIQDKREFQKILTKSE